MKKERLQKILTKNNACDRIKAAARGKSLKEYVLRSLRADDLLWLYHILHKDEDLYDHRDFFKSKAICVKYISHLITDLEAKELVEVLTSYGNNQATKEELLRTTYAAYAAKSAHESVIYSTAIYSPRVTAVAVYIVATIYADSEDIDKLSVLKDMADNIRFILFPEYK